MVVPKYLRLIWNHSGIISGTSNSPCQGVYYLYRGPFFGLFWAILLYDFSEIGGGGQRPFRTFPKAHPFWGQHFFYFLAALEALHTTNGLTPWPMIYHSERSMRQCTHLQPPITLHKQVEGYMSSDNLQFSCVQPPDSSQNLQIPHGHHGHHGCHDHRGSPWW